MNKQHASEQMIQFTVTGEARDEATIAHLAICEDCQLKAAAYRLILEEIKTSAKPAFEFDLVAAVVDQLVAEEKTRLGWQLSDYLLSICAILLLAVPVFCYRTVLAAVIAGVQPAVLVAVIVTAVLTITFGVSELQDKWRKQTSLLNSGGNLQH